MKHCEVLNCTGKFYARNRCSYHYHQLPDRIEALRRNSANYRNKDPDLRRAKDRAKYQENKDNPEFKARVKSSRDRNREQRRQGSKKWHENNKEHDKEYRILYGKENAIKLRERSRLYNLNNREKRRKYENKRHSERRKTDPLFKLKRVLRSRFSNIFKEGFKSGSVVRDLGCTIEDFKKWLESKFQPGMTWDNYGVRGWHIDHVIPLSSFDLSNREQFKKACHYTNLQPLWWIDNLLKGSKIN